MRWTIMSAVCFLLIAGCTNNQLRRSTVGQARTLTEIQHQQVLQNLASIAGNPYAIPRHVTLHDGTAQITDNGSILGQLINMRFFNMGAQRTIVDQWSMTPVTNDVALRLLRVAYRRAWGSQNDLYTDDLANDFAQELKKQTYQVDDLRTLVENAQIPVARKTWEDSVRDAKGDAIETFIPETVGLTAEGPDRKTAVIPQKPKLTPGITGIAAELPRVQFQKIASANSLHIVYPGERISDENLSIAEVTRRLDDDGTLKPIVDKDLHPMTVYRPATPLVIELRRQVYDTNKDLEDIHPGWLERSTNKHDIPKDACYVAYAHECGKLWYVWVCPNGLQEFEDFTIKILNFAGLIKEPTVSGSTGVKFTPSGPLTK
jgi:hypothetical protein